MSALEPEEGLTITIAAGHSMLTTVVKMTDEVTERVADLVATLQHDPVDVIALGRRAGALLEAAQYLADEVEDFPGVTVR